MGLAAHMAMEQERLIIFLNLMALTGNQHLYNE